MGPPPPTHARTLVVIRSYVVGGGERESVAGKLREALQCSPPFFFFEAAHPRRRREKNKEAKEGREGGSKCVCCFARRVCASRGGERRRRRAIHYAPPAITLERACEGRMGEREGGGGGLSCVVASVLLDCLTAKCRLSGGEGKKQKWKRGELFLPSYTTPQKRRHDRSTVVLFDLCFALAGKIRLVIAWME